MKFDPNPQGKGLIPLLQDVTSSRTGVRVPPKNIDQISAELFTSLFVLESEFSFKPVAGKEYHLYQRGDRFRLSLVGPDEWSSTIFGQYIGRCVMERDITWTLELDSGAALDAHLYEYIAAKRRIFENSLETAEALEHILPVYCAALPYYQRLFASALAHSLGISMKLSGIKGLSYNEAKGLLEYS